MKKYILSTAVVLGLAVVGCQDPQDTIAKVYVVDEEGSPVSGATVSLSGNPSDEQEGVGKELSIADTTTSNAAGEAIFNLNEFYKGGQAGVAVLDITARLGDSTGTGIIKVEEETTSEETVFIQD